MGDDKAHKKRSRESNEIPIERNTTNRSISTDSGDDHKVMSIEKEPEVSNKEAKGASEKQV
jgi:hypothetical protein